MEFKFRLNEIDKVAASFTSVFNKYRIIAFHGNMGAGKTTFISALCKQLKVTDNVSSPTYSIINQYAGNDGMVYHLDLYRLKDEEEAIQAGVEECVLGDNLCLIEWPERIKDVLPAGVLHVIITVVDSETRMLSYEFPSGEFINNS